MDKTPVMYLAGPMTTPEQRKEFTKRQLEYEAGGWDVINPTLHVPGWMDRPGAMRVCLDYIDRADVVLMLLGWKRSRGARLERQYALYTGKEVRWEKYDGTWTLDPGW